MRPLCFLDIEATGLDRENDRIVELSIIKLFPDGSQEFKTRRFNPGIAIPEATTKIHGITDDHVKDEPRFKDVAKSLLDYITDCDLAGYNCNNFDVPMLFFEFLRADLYLDYTKIKIIDVGNIFKIKEQRTLEAAYKFYCDKQLENAHSAEADTKATLEVFESQLERYEDLPKTIEALAKYSNFDKEIIDISGKFTYNEAGKVIFNFGKYKGELATDHPDFLDWMVNKANFSKDTCMVALKLLKSCYGQ